MGKLLISPSPYTCISLFSLEMKMDMKVGLKT